MAKVNIKKIKCPCCGGFLSLKDNGYGEVKEESNPVLEGEIRNPGQMQMLDWEAGPVFVLITSKDEHKTLYKKAFKQVCSTFEISKEVEVPVSADTAWINGKGEIVGGSAGFNPGSGWTQMDKKY